MIYVKEYTVNYLHQKNDSVTGQSKTILITGASRGIGEKLALCYATPNVNLILIAKNHEKLCSVSKSCRDQGANVLVECLDIQDDVKLKQYLLDIDQSMPIDLVIANAGVASTLQPNWQPEIEEDINRTFAINLQGTLNTINPLINRMIARKHGQIAIMSSLAGLRGLPQSPSYSASKGAIAVYGQALRACLARYHIQVNVIYPGYVKSDMSDALSGLKPFLISSERAAQIIQKGLSKNKPSISFPWQLNYLTRLARILPSNFIDKILNRFESTNSL